MYFAPLLLISQSTDHISQNQQPFVYINALSEPHSLCSRSLYAFTARKIHKMKLTFTHLRFSP